MRDVYSEVKEHFSGDPGVEVLKGRGAQGIKLGSKMFAMFLKGDLLVKLPEKRVNEVIESGDGVPYAPGTGKPMKNRVLIPALNKDLWIKYCVESREHAE